MKMKSYHVLGASAMMVVSAVILANPQETPGQVRGEFDILGPAVERKPVSTSSQLDLKVDVGAMAASATTPLDVEERARPTAEDSGDGFAEEMWLYLKHGPVAYDEWRAFPGKPEALQRGRSPHGSRIRLVANRKARMNSSSLIHGSMLLLENYNATGNRLTSITLMYRSEGYDPQHNDWFWAKYRPDGTLAKVNGRPGAGRMSSCIECHKQAGGGDFVFAND